MPQTEIINHRQMAWMVSAIIVGAGMISSHNELIRICRMDAWFSYAIPVIYAFLIAALYSYLSLHYPGKNIFTIAFELTGKWIGGLINFLFLLHIWFILLWDIRSYTKYLKTIHFPNTPEEVLVIIFVLLLLYFGRFNIEVAVRTNDIFLPLFFLTTFFTPFLLTNEIHLKGLEPLMLQPPTQVAIGNVLTSGWYGEIFVVGAFLHSMANSKQIRSSIRHGTLIGTLILIVFLVMELIVLGSNLPSQTLYPSFTLVQQVHITDFLDRLDLFLLGIWFFIKSVKVIFIYLAFLLAINCFGQKSNPHMFNKPAAVFLIITSVLAFKEPTEIFLFGNYGFVVIVLAYQPIVFVTLWITSWLRHRKQSNAQQDASSADAAASSGQGQSHRGKNIYRGGRNVELVSGFLTQLSNKMSLKGWRRSSNILIATGIALIAFGYTFGLQSPALGMIGGWGYMVCTFIMFITTLMEVVHAPSDQ